MKPAENKPQAPSGDAASATVFVHVSQRDAFEIFTEEIDAWWRTGPQYRIAGKKRGRLFFETKLGGRVFETFETSTGSRTIEVGLVTTWEPPARIELEWRGANFKPGEKTFVEVTFTEQPEGTMVTVRHRGWSALPPNHPARHGLVGAEFSRKIGLWWGGLMTALREHAETRKREPSPD